MKLCFLAAANSIHSYKWVKFFADLGHEVLWISLAPKSFELPENVKYIELDTSKKSLGLLLVINKARRIIASFSPDILHVHYVGSYGVLGLFSGVPVIVATPWGSDVIEGKQSLVKRWFVSRILRRAKLVTCDACHMLNEVVELGVPSERIHIINFGIDSDRFSRQESSQEIRRQFGLESEPTVISLRNFEPVYDIETLIKAVPIVLDSVTNTHFILVGKGSLKENLVSLASHLGVSHAVNFVGFIQNEQLPQTLCSMDVYVSTSLSDAGIAASTAEAMACELPVVVTDSGENDKWIIDGENGFLVPISCPERLAERLIELLNNESLRSKFGKAGRNTIRKRNDYKIEMSKMDNLYHKVSGLK